MVNAPSQARNSSAVSDIVPLRESFLRHLHAENKAPSTRVANAKAIDQFAEFVRGQGMPQTVAAIHREQIEHFLVSVRERGMRPATVSQRYRSLQQFLRWLSDEGQIPDSPMAELAGTPA